VNLDDFAAHYHQEVLARSDNREELREESFTELVLEDLSEANETGDSDVCCGRWPGRRGTPAAKVNGISFAGDGATLDLFVCRYHGTGGVQSTPPAEISEHFRLLRGFLERSLAGFYRELEESHEVFDAARRIYEQRDALSTVRLFLLTDGAARMDRVELPVEPIDGLEVRHAMWDLEKLWQFHSSGRAREVVTLDFAETYGDPVACIGQADATGEYRTYLAFVPGATLARIYGDHGPRLLERNVRSFLQVRGKINKGIQETIANEPHRFLAYNNGLSASAREIDIIDLGDGHYRLKRATDFQIVNGGQTTASIYHAWKKEKRDVSQLMVQVKLTVANDPELLTEFVPLISLYANSQNKVNTADFSANGPFHRKLEELSRTIWAPAPGGLERGTRWYYERARGSYLDEKSRAGTKAQIQQWEAANPLQQKFSKTDLAKFENAWDELPHWVCLGAEKNFGRWTDRRQEHGWPVVDEGYFHQLVGKAILLRGTERIVSAHGLPGYRAQIVAYALAWLVRKSGRRLPLDEIWKTQALSQKLSQALDAVARAARDYLIRPPDGRNITEWCKRPECWEGFCKIDISLPRTWDNSLNAEEYKLNVEAPTNPVAQEAITAVRGVPADYWFGLSKWAKERGHLQPWQRALAFSLGRLAAQDRPPSPRQAAQAVKIMETVKELGFVQT
jgi:hypothetical protein